MNLNTPSPLDSTDSLALESLDRRLTIIRDRVRGVALGHHTGFYLFGTPGTSKTYTVRKTLDSLKCKYCYHDGHLTPMGLFELLQKQPDRVILLDDVSALFQQPVALQLLLAALGKQPDDAGERMVKYQRQGREAVVHFTGGIICISNLQLHAMPLLEALKSRVHYLQFAPSDEELAALMRAVASTGRSDLSPEEGHEVAEFLIAESQRLAVRLDMRLLVDKAFPDYRQWRSGHTEAHWKDLVRTTLEERLVDLQYTPLPRQTREERKEQEREIISELTALYPTTEERIAAWQERTGKSRRGFFRRLAEVGSTVPAAEHAAALEPVR